MTECIRDRRTPGLSADPRSYCLLSAQVCAKRSHRMLRSVASRASNAGITVRAEVVHAVESGPGHPQGQVHATPVDGLIRGLPSRQWLTVNLVGDRTRQLRSIGGFGRWLATRRGRRDRSVCCPRWRRVPCLDAPPKLVGRHLDVVQFDADTKATSHGSHLVTFDPRPEPKIEDDAQAEAQDLGPGARVPVRSSPRWVCPMDSSQGPTTIHPS